MRRGKRERERERELMRIWVCGIRHTHHLPAKACRTVFPFSQPML